MKKSLFYDYREKRDKYRTPPLGIKPKFIHDRQRLRGLKAAIQRMMDADEPIYQDWIEEYNELLEKIYK